MIGLVFSPEQFAALLRMIYIGNTVANGHRDEALITHFEDLEQYVFSRAKDAGLPLAAWSHREGGEEHHHPSHAFEEDEEVNRLLDEYDAHVMFELLAERLAERDLEREFGKEAFSAMTIRDRENLVHDRSERYRDVFLTFGVDAITVMGMGEKSA